MEREKDLQRIKKFLTEHKRLTTATLLLVIILYILSQLIFANWLFQMKFNGWWMSNKAGVNIWDITFEKGYYWQVLWLIPLIWFLSNPFFWRKGASMKLVFRLFHVDEKTTFAKRALTGLILALLKAFVGFIVAASIGHAIARQWLLVDTYLRMSGMNWVEFIQRIYLPAINYYLLGGLPSANYLLEHTIVFDFLDLLSLILLPLLLYHTFVKLPIASYITLTERKREEDGELERKIIKVFKYILIAGFAWSFYWFILLVPSTVGDISVPIYVQGRLALVFVLALLGIVFHYSEESMAKWLGEHAFQTVFITTTLISIILFAPTAIAWWNYHVQQNYSASKNIFEFPYRIQPHISYVKWANDLSSIQVVQPEALKTPPEFEESILKDVRVISYTAALKQMIYAYGVKVGQPWMKLAVEQDGDKYYYGPMIVWANNHEYWVCPTSPVLPEVSDIVEGKRYVYIRSQSIIAVDAASGEITDFDKIFPQVNMSTLSMYYGIGGLFREQNEVYLNIGKWKEASLPSYKGPASYDKVPDYVLSDKDTVIWGASERWWFFFWRGEFAFADGKYGREISVLFKRDVVERINSLLIEGLEVEKEPSTGKPIPYLVVSPEGNIYYCFAIYINKKINNAYTDTSGYLVRTSGNFRRLFAIALVNSHDGTIKGYRYGNWDENYITNYFASFYSSWNNEIPEWLKEQLRFPKSLEFDLIDLYNTYHIDSNDWESWYKTLNMYDLPVDRDWNYFNIKLDDIRYVPVYYQGKLVYAGIRIVELYKQKPEPGQWSARQVAGVYIFLGTGERFFIPLKNALAIQLLLDSVNTNSEIQYILTTRRQQGQQWEEGNLILYLIGEKPIFFIPYYTTTPTVMKVTMVVAIDGTNGKIGYYLLSPDPTPEEVMKAASKAYVAVQKGILKGEEERIEKVKEEIASFGLTVKTPKVVNPMVAEYFATVDFKITQAWDEVKSVIQRFVQEVCIPNNVSKVYVWYQVGETTKTLYVGALLPDLTMQILAINIA
ncbi:MAG: hypothetical protein ACP5O8_03715 [Candidatus Aenigmatarchaeota archaeon]